MGFLRIVCALVVCLAAARCQEDMWYADPESPPQIQTLTAADFDSVVSSKAVTVVHFMDSQTEDASIKKMRLVNKRMMQGAAQHQGQDTDTVFAEVDMSDNKELSEQHGVVSPNTVLVYKNGRKHAFHGYRSPDVLLAFIKQVGSPVINVINNKNDKKSFDKLPSTKVIGYFDSVSPAYETFRQAAEHFYPEVPFYAVLDPLVAAQVKMVTPGEVVIVKAPVKEPILPATPLATLEDYKTFVEKAGSPLLQTISPEVFHKLMSASAADPFVVAFVRQMSPECKQLFKALKGLVKAGHTTVPIKLFDVDQYPLLQGIVQKLEIDTSMPSLGLLNISTIFQNGAKSWFNMSQFSAITDKYQQMEMVLNWLFDVQLGNIRVDGEPSANVPRPVVNLAAEKAAKKEDNPGEPVAEKTSQEERQPRPEVAATGQEVKTKKPKKNKKTKMEGESTEETQTAESENDKEIVNEPEISETAAIKKQRKNKADKQKIEKNPKHKVKKDTEPEKQAKEEEETVFQVQEEETKPKKEKKIKENKKKQAKPAKVKQDQGEEETNKEQKHERQEKDQPKKTKHQTKENEQVEKRNKKEKKGQDNQTDKKQDKKKKAAKK